MQESNEPQDFPEGKQVYLPASPDTPDIPLEDVEVPPEPKPDPIAP